MGSGGTCFCCSVVVVVCSPPLFTVWAWTYLTRWELHLCEGGGLPAVYAQEWLTLPRHAPWLWLVVLIQERWILANQITATGWSHRQLTCIWFYCQIIMTILTNITKKIAFWAANKHRGLKKSIPDVKLMHLCRHEPHVVSLQLTHTGLNWTETRQENPKWNCELEFFVDGLFKIREWMFGWPMKNSMMCRGNISTVKFELNIWREENYKLNKTKSLKYKFKLSQTVTRW